MLLRSPSATCWVRKLRSLFLLLGFALGVGGDDRPPLGRRGDAGPVARRVAGGRRRGDRAARRASTSRRCGPAAWAACSSASTARATSLASSSAARGSRRSSRIVAPGHRGQAALPASAGRTAGRRRCAPAARSRAAPPRSVPGSTRRRRAGTTPPPIRPGSRRPRSSSTTSWTDFTLPPAADSTWAEWHYFNVVTGPGEWWYVTLLIGGAVPAGRWGGQLLVTHRRPDGRYERFAEPVPAARIRFDTTAADLTLGSNAVRQRLGSYQVSARIPGRLELDFTLRPAPQSVLPRGRAAGGAVHLRVCRPRAVGIGGRTFLRGRALPGGNRRHRLPRSQLGRMARGDVGVGRGAWRDV